MKGGGSITAKEKNPYTRDFGTVPNTYISRFEPEEEIDRSFLDEITDDKAYFIVGQRGFGKSVLLRAVKAKMSGQKDWIVIELRSNHDNLIHQLAAELYSEKILSQRLSELKIDLSLLGLGLSISSKAEYISSDDIAIRKMLDIAESKGKKVLILIDEIHNSRSIRELCALFNLYKGDEYPIYFIMDGLFKNTTALENVKDLTFLKRVPKLKMTSLDLNSVVESYKEYLKLDTPDLEPVAERLAVLSKGYPYAFQLIGYFAWLMLSENPDLAHDYPAFEKEILKKVDSHLNEYVYSTVWTEISETEQDILRIMAIYGLKKVADIRTQYEKLFPERAEMTPANFSKYRDKLIKAQILVGKGTGRLDFALPRFDRFVKLHHSLEYQG